MVQLRSHQNVLRVFIVTVNINGIWLVGEHNMRILPTVTQSYIML